MSLSIDMLIFSPALGIRDSLVNWLLSIVLLFSQVVSLNVNSSSNLEYRNSYLSAEYRNWYKYLLTYVRVVLKLNM